MLNKIMFDIEQQLQSNVSKLSIAVVGNDSDLDIVKNKLINENILFQFSPDSGFTSMCILKDGKGIVELIHNYVDYTDYPNLKCVHIDTLYVCKEISDLKEDILKDLLKPKNCIVYEKAVEDDIFPSIPDVEYVTETLTDLKYR